MKRVLSLVLTAAIAASLVPATAFAASGDVKATAKVVGAWTRNQDALGNGVISGSNVPELQLKVNSVAYPQTTGKIPETSFTVTLDNANFNVNETALKNGVVIVDEDGKKVGSNPQAGVNTGAESYVYSLWNEDQIKEKLLKPYWENGTKTMDGYQVVKADTVDGKEYSTNAQRDNANLFDSLANPVTKSQEKVALEYLETNKAAFGITTASDYVLGMWGGEKAFVKSGNTTPADPSFVYYSAVVAHNGGKDFVEEKTEYSTWVTTAIGQVTTNLATKKVATEVYKKESDTYTGNGQVEVTVKLEAKNEAKVTLKGWLKAGYVISFDLLSEMEKTSKNATVSVDSDMVDKVDNLPYVTVADKGFSASVKKTVKVAQDEVVFLHDNGLKLKESVRDSFAVNDEVSLKLSKGFKFVKTDVYVNGEKASDVNFDGNELTFKVTSDMLKAAGAMNSDGLVTLTIKSKVNGKDDGLKIEADGAKSGAKASITAKVGKLDKVSVEVAEVVDYKVVMSTDKDKDLPVIYSGTNVNNEGITDSSNHKTVEITLEETFPGAWSMRQGFNITLPDGVYVADVEVKDAENFFQNGKELGSTDAKKAWQDAFEKAYKDGEHKNFEFGKRVFDDVNVTLAKNPAKVTFVLVLVADPGFEGDVKVGFEGALVDKQSVSAAKFVVPYKVEAQQNDLKIDTRNTKIPTDIMVKETADGLWDKGKQAATFTFNIEKNLIRFEDDAKFTVDKNSELEVTDTQKNNKLEFSVKSVSDKAATVTISDMSLFMDRNIPAGKYALEMKTTMSTAYDAQRLFANADSNAAADARDNKTDLKLKGDNYISDVTKYKKTVKDSFINVVTAPRDEDGFTTKITVPVGEKYVVAGEKKIEIDTPAYINDKGYTMLPLRAVAVALGIDNNSVLWDQNTRTATILYGNRVVSMQAGASTMYINGQAVATKAGVEITNDRTFLSLRDLGTAVNVKDISWDGATKTAYLNYGEKAAM